MEKIIKNIDKWFLESDDESDYDAIYKNTQEWIEKSEQQHQQQLNLTIKDDKSFHLQSRHESIQDHIAIPDTVIEKLSHMNAEEATEFAIRLSEDFQNKQEENCKFLAQKRFDLLSMEKSKVSDFIEKAQEIQRRRIDFIDKHDFNDQVEVEVLNYQSKLSKLNELYNLVEKERKHLEIAEQLSNAMKFE